MSRMGSSMRAERGLVAARRWRREEWRVTAGGHRVSLWGDKTFNKIILWSN